MTGAYFYFLDWWIHIPTLVFYAPEILLIIGLFFLFPKCGKNRFWSLVPGAKYYHLAKCAGMSEEALVWAAGIVLAKGSLIWFLFSRSFHEVFSYSEEFQTAVYIPFILSLIFLGVAIVYSLRISAALCKTFQMKRIWIAAWVLVDFFPAVYWGLNKKIQPVIQKNETSKAAMLSGRTAAPVEEGLTIDINARTIRERMKKNVLLKDIHLSIPKGHMVLLLGGSGAGKTCFINAVNGYEQADATILLNGENVYRSFNQVKYNIAYVPQQDMMRLGDTVENILECAARLRMPKDISKEQREARVKEVLEHFGLEHVKNHRISKLSGGQRKRVSIAMEFMSSPDVYMLDEPDSGLDGILAHDLIKKLNEISRQGKIVIVITHAPDRVIEYFDDVIVLAKDHDYIGRLVFYGSIDEAKKFFERDSMEGIVKAVNRKEEGGDGLADELIEKFGRLSNEAERES